MPKTTLSSPLKVAIVAEWLSTYAGSERVLEAFLDLFPEADLFAVVDFVPEGDRHFLRGRTPKVSFIQQLPGARRFFRHYLPLMPLAIEQFDLSAYDLVISNSHAVAKGVLTGPNQRHLSYVHSPMRYAWDLQHQYLREGGLDRGVRGGLARLMLHYLRLWDSRTAQGVDHYLTNSRYIQRRIRKIYGRDSTVIHPPVDVEAFPLKTVKADYYFTASRMVPYKRMDLIVEAFKDLPDRQLLVAGTGPEYEKIARLKGPNVELLGHLDAGTLRHHLQNARAFLFAAEEDFGILPLEAMACGTPVIAYGRGGALETVVPLGDDALPTGLFFDSQTPQSLLKAIGLLEANALLFDPAAIRRHAEQFRPERFVAEIKEMLEILNIPFEEGSEQTT